MARWVKWMIRLVRHGEMTKKMAKWVRQMV